MTKDLNVLVTGASGFVGKVLCRQLLDRGVILSVLTRNMLELGQGVKQYVFEGLETVQPKAEWFDGIDVVIHLAARVHQMQSDPEHEARLQMTANRDATLKLASMAAESGVKQFIYLSSIKVNGEHTEGRPPFSESDSPAPVDFYGQSKWEAEQGLYQLVEGSDLNVTVIRPPLVYGEEVKANFRALLKLCGKGLPLPFGLINNGRSIVSVDNLVSFIICCCVNQAALNQTFMVADRHAISTPALVRLMASSQGRSAVLLPFPVVALMLLAMLVNKKSAVERLVQSLELDCSKAEQLLGWFPPAATDNEFKRYSVKWMS